MSKTYLAEYLRNHADFLQRDLEAKDATRRDGALARIRRTLPATRTLRAEEVIRDFRRSDALDVVAVEQGFANWRAFAAGEPAAEVGTAGDPLQNPKVKALLDAANDVWTDAAEGGVDIGARISGNLIRKLAEAVVDLSGRDELREYAWQWPSTEDLEREFLPANGSKTAEADNRPSVDELDAFTTGYVACLLEVTVDELTDSEGEPLGDHYFMEDIDRVTFERMKAECATFQRANATDLERAYEMEDSSGIAYHAERAGHDLWLARQGYGVGFSDRGLGEVGERLQAAAKALGYQELEVGDDGRVYILG